MRTFEELFFNAETYEAIESFAVEQAAHGLALSIEEVKAAQNEPGSDAAKLVELMLSFASSVLEVSYDTMRADIETENAKPKIIIAPSNYNPKKFH